MPTLAGHEAEAHIGADTVSIADLRAFITEQKKEIRRYHDDHKGGGQGGGKYVVTALSDLADRLLQRCFERMDPILEQGWHGALVALGGYGRRELSPASDMDVMFLCSKEEAQQTGAIASTLLCALWDVGYKVGHSLRTLEDCLEMADRDLVTATALLEARRLAGNAALFQQFQQAFSLRMGKKSKQFLTELRQARDAEEVCLLEPDIKRSPGALREVHHIRWAALAHHQIGTLEHMHGHDLLSDIEYSDLIAAEDLLWRIRNWLHFQCGASDYLATDLQYELAEFLGFENRRDLMRHYYIHTTRVLSISRQFFKRTMPASARERIHLWWTTRNLMQGVWQSGDEIVASPEGLDGDHRILHLFALAKARRARLSPPTLDAISRAPQCQPSPSSEVCALFRQMLCEPGGLAETLRWMHRTHFLWKIIPEFAHVEFHVQESRSHAFTIDEHTFHAIDAAERLMQEEGSIGQIYRTLRRKDILHLALLLHDLGKGLGGDHSAAGAQIAADVAVRLGYSEEDVEHIVFLVQRHLLYSDIAFYRDFSNEPVLLQFVKTVGQIETLQHLFILTCADTRAVGPNIWTPWKKDLLLKLYREAHALLSGELPEAEDIETRWVRIRTDTRHQYPQIWLDAALEALDRHYLASTPYPTLLLDLSALFHLATEPLQVQCRRLPAGNADVVEYTLYTADAPELFSKMTGALAACGLNILSAQVTTHANIWVVDRFQAISPGGRLRDEEMTRIAEDVRRILAGEQTVEALMSHYRRFTSPSSGHLGESDIQVEIDNESSRHFTIVDVFAPDRHGLLYVIAQALFALEVSVHSAIIATRLDQVVDVFYVSYHQRKITDPERIHHMKTDLSQHIRHALSEETS